MMTPDDLAAQLRQCATDMASKNLLVAEAARGQAPGLLAGAADALERLGREIKQIGVERDALVRAATVRIRDAEQERDAERAAIDRHVADVIVELHSGAWRNRWILAGLHGTRAEAEAAYREATGLNVDTSKEGTSHE